MECVALSAEEIVRDLVSRDSQCGVKRVTQAVRQTHPEYDSRSVRTLLEQERAACAKQAATTSLPPATAEPLLSVSDDLANLELSPQHGRVTIPRITPRHLGDPDKLIGQLGQRSGSPIYVVAHASRLPAFWPKTSGRGSKKKAGNANILQGGVTYVVYSHRNETAPLCDAPLGSILLLLSGAYDVRLLWGGDAEYEEGIETGISAICGLDTDNSECSLFFDSDERIEMGRTGGLRMRGPRAVLSDVAVHCEGACQTGGLVNVGEGTALFMQNVLLAGYDYFQTERTRRERPGDSDSDSEDSESPHGRYINAAAMTDTLLKVGFGSRLLASNCGFSTSCVSGIDATRANAITLFVTARSRSAAWAKRASE